MSNDKYLEEVRSNLMRLDVEELEERKRKGMFDERVIKLVDEIILLKNNQPEVIKEEKKISPMTRRLVAAAAVGGVGYLYMWLKRGGKQKNS
jgi:hypothetical protein